MASELRVNTLKDASGNNSIATSFVAGGSAKAWAKYGMDDATIDDSLNLASITDNGTGDFTNSWSSSFGTINYANLANCNIGAGNSNFNKQDFYTPLVGSVRLYTTFHNGSSDSGTGTAYDFQFVSLLAHGDLA